MTRHTFGRLFPAVFLMFLIPNGASAENDILVVQKLLTGGKIDAVDFAETFEFTLSDKLLYVDAKINGSPSPFRFVFDTYAVNLVRQNLIDLLNIEVTDLTGPFAEQLGRTLLAPRMVRFGSIRLGNLTFQDYGGFAIKEDSTHDILDYLEDGIIGANLMNGAIWQINFRDSTIRVTDNISRCGFIEGAVRLPFRPHSLQKSPNIEVVVNDGEILDIQFDTGSNAVLKFNTDNPASYTLPGRSAKLTSVPALNMGEESADVFVSTRTQLESVRIGSHVFENLPAEIFETSDETLVRRGQLGNAFMRHFIVTIDWYDNMIYLFPREENPLETQKRSFGLSIGIRDGAVRVLALYEGSRAEQAGLKIGDLVLSIDGRDMTQLSDEETRLYIQGFRKFLDEKAAAVALRVDSGGEIRDIQLESYDLFRRNDRKS